MQKRFLEKQNNITKNMYFQCFELLIKKRKKKLQKCMETTIYEETNEQ